MTPYEVMPKSTKPSQAKGRSTPTTKADPKKSPRPKAAPTPAAPKRDKSKSQREAQQQQRVMRGVAAGILIALLVIIAGLVYDQLWIPSRVVAQVNDAELTRRAYWQEYRDMLATQIVQSLQMVAMFGDNEQFGNQFKGRTPLINEQVTAIRSEETDNQQVIDMWKEDQLIIQGAQSMAIQASTDEINQKIVVDMGSAFLSPEEAETPDATDTLTDTTDVVTDTLATDVLTETDTDALPTPDGPPPTSTPIPTPEPTVANQKVSQVFAKVADMFQEELDEIEERDLKPRFTSDDFLTSMQERYRVQLYTERIQEHLVPEDTFEPSTEPDRVSARHILLEVDVPITLTQTMTPTQEISDTIDAAYEERLPEAEDIVEELRDGADFEAMVEEYSEDPGSKDQGGDVGTFDEDGASSQGATYDPAFVEAAFELEVDEISDPVRTQFGWHIIQVTEWITNTVEQQLQEARNEAFDEWLEEQREAATIQQFPQPSPTATEQPSPTTEPTYMPGPPTAPPTSTPTPGADTTATPTLIETLTTMEEEIDNTEPLTDTNDADDIDDTEPLTNTDDVDDVDNTDNNTDNTDEVDDTEPLTDTNNADEVDD